MTASQAFDAAWGVISKHVKEDCVEAVKKELPEALLSTAWEESCDA